MLCNEKAKYPEAFSDNFVLENPRLNVMRSRVALVIGSQLVDIINESVSTLLPNNPLPISVVIDDRVNGKG